MHLRVLITTRTAAEARSLGAALVEGRLAASAQVRPIFSTYRWNEQVEAHDEAELALLTTRARYPALEAAVLAAHAYVLPQIIAQPIEGSAAFLAWIAENTR